ncbi:MAG: thiamine pyrophosphate-dependent enzyme [Nitrospiraceae bacterium]|nr:thiamine pyrophosphate-dependent enzyme [Nitrospiraceae bacterium]
MHKVFSRPSSLKDKPFRYCPGCSHGVLHRIVAETIDLLGVRDRTIGIAPVGCAVFAYDYFDIDMIEVPHGRPPAIATGMKRSRPEAIIFSYQGDGDLAAIGTAEIVHAAARGENITVIFVNNGNYGMTGGQMAPTTLPGQKTTTTPGGRDVRLAGNPLRMCEMLATLDGPVYIERVSVDSPRNVQNATKAIQRAFKNQIEGRGFSFVEALSMCPTDWGLTPKQAIEWVRNSMMKYYPLGVYKDIGSAQRAKGQEHTGQV